MEFRWLLLLPVYRYAYIGMIANAYAKEQGTGGINYSVYEVVFSTIFTGCLSVVLWRTTTNTILMLCAISAMWGVLRTVENFIIFRMFNKHPALSALFGYLPGVILFNARAALKVLETM